MVPSYVKNLKCYIHFCNMHVTTLYKKNFNIILFYNFLIIFIKSFIKSLILKEVCEEF